MEGDRVNRLIALLQKLDARHYVSGPSARDYLDPGAFAEAGIGLEFMTYDYPAYEQLYPPYDPHVSILDTLFMEGHRAGELIWDRPAGRGA